MSHALRSLRAIVAPALCVLGLVACGDALTVNIVGSVTGESINSAASADALRIGALGSVNAITVGDTALMDRGWMDIGLFTDEWRASAPSIHLTELDRRSVRNNNMNLWNLYANLHRARARAREAIDALQKYKPQPAWGIGQMYIATALAELQVAEYFCNGVPLSAMVDGEVAYGQPRTSAQIFAVANEHLDSAVAYLGAVDNTTAQHRSLARILKARVLLDIGGQAAAAALQVKDVPTSFAYQITFASGTGDNGIWSGNALRKYSSVGDSADAAGTIANAIPFASGGDPRVRVVGSSIEPSSQGFGADNATPLVVQTMWGRLDAVNLASGLDARLVEAEERLQADDLAGMTAILNGLRAAPPALTPIYTPLAMPALPVPSNKNAAVRLFFREKALWTFSRGQRLGDLRRMVRQYGFTQDQVFPSGAFFKGGSYGTETNLDVSSLERNNPNFSGCIDRDA